MAGSLHDSLFKALQTGVYVEPVPGGHRFVGNFGAHLHGSSLLPSVLNYMKQVCCPRPPYDGFAAHRWLATLPDLLLMVLR